MKIVSIREMLELKLMNNGIFQVNLESCGNELHATQRQYEESQHAREILTSKLLELTAKLDSSNINLSELSKERESLQRVLESLRTEKHSVDKDKVELNLMIETQNFDLEKTTTARSHLQKMYDVLLEEKKMLDLDLQCVRKDKEITEMNLRFVVFFFLELSIILGKIVTIFFFKLTTFDIEKCEKYEEKKLANNEPKRCNDQKRDRKR